MNSASRLVAGLATIAVALGVAVVLVAPRLGPGAGAQPTPSPSVAPTAAASPGATANDAACKLVTTDEARNSTNNPGLGATTGATEVGAVTTCIYSTGGGDIVLALTSTNPGGQAAFDAIKAKAGMRSIAGIGTEAVFDPTTETMYVVKGDSMVAVRSGLFVTDRLATETQLAKLVAGRM